MTCSCRDCRITVRLPKHPRLLRRVLTLLGVVVR